MTPRPHRLRRTQVTLAAFGLAFAGLAPSALAATGESEETRTFGAAVADASAAREPTGAAARVTAAVSEAAGRRSTAPEASDTFGDSSADRGADARGERSDDSEGPTDSAVNGDRGSSVRRPSDKSATIDEDDGPSEDDGSSVERAVDRSTSDVRDRPSSVAEKATTTVRPASRRVSQPVREQAEPIVEKAHESVEETVDLVETTLAATRQVIDQARAIAGGIGRDKGEAPSEPAPDAAHPATTAPAAFDAGARVGSRRESLPAREAPGRVGLVTRLVERFVPMPATAASAPPAGRRRPGAALRPRGDGPSEQAAPSQAPWTPAPADSARLAPLGDSGPSDWTDIVPSGGLTSISLTSGASAATIAALCLTAPSLLRRLRLPPALVRPVAFVSLLERPG